MAKKASATEIKVQEQQNVDIHIKPIKKTTTTITLVGDSPLIVHAWSEKAKKQMLETQMKTDESKKAKKAKEPKNPVRDFFDTIYWIPGFGEKPKFKDSWSEDQCIAAIEDALKNGAKMGFPVTGIKQCAYMSVYRAGMTQNTTAFKQAFFLKGCDCVEYATIEGIDGELPKVLMREDMVKIGGMSKTADLRYRVMYENWKMRIQLTTVDTGVFTIEDVINAIQFGGFSNGIGEWRSERDGLYGAFHVEGVE